VTDQQGVMTNCRKCGTQHPVEDLCSEGLCVVCWDRAASSYYGRAGMIARGAGTAPPGFLLLSPWSLHRSQVGSAVAEVGLSDRLGVQMGKSDTVSIMDFSLLCKQAVRSTIVVRLLATAATLPKVSNLNTALRTPYIE